MEGCCLEIKLLSRTTPPHLFQLGQQLLSRLPQIQRPSSHLGSFNDLNRQLSKPVPLEDFRPHLVVRGCGPHAETSWHRIAIGATGLRLIGPRTECPALATLDGGTVLERLEAYRRRQPRAAFGVHARPDSPGEIRTGTRVDLLA